MKLENLIGLRFGRLIVVAQAKSTKGKRRWECECDCGNKSITTTYQLKNGKAKSCGCLGRELTRERSFKHGYSYRGNVNRLYSIWNRMRYRCINPNSSDSDRYFKRGITVCDEWGESFIAFKNWALTHGYKENLTIERINNNGDYCPENCTWIPLAQQARNKRNNHFITIGETTKTLAEWAEITGIESSLIRFRLNRKWPLEKLFVKPYHKNSDEKNLFKKHCA